MLPGHDRMKFFLVGVIIPQLDRIQCYEIIDMQPNTHPGYLCFTQFPPNTKVFA